MAWRGLTGITGNIYCGLHEFEDMAFVLHLLRQDDWFIDVGANVGSYTILGGATGANVTAIEPLPKTFKILQKNIMINVFPQKVEALNIGIAAQEGILFFTNYLDTVNHVVPEGTSGSQPVPVSTIDQLCKQECPLLIKIDVEGYELEALKGAADTLKKASLKALIVEINETSSRYKTDEPKISNVEEMLKNYGFFKMKYYPSERILRQSKDLSSRSNNLLFVRDEDFVQERITSSKFYNIAGKSL